MNPTAAARVRHVPPALVLAAATVSVLAYLQALNFPLASDDTMHLTSNAKLLGLRAADLWRLFAEPFNALREYLPLRELSFWLDINLFGLNPAAFRLHNIVLQLLCLPLVFATTQGLWRYFRPAEAADAPWAAAAVTALFALHPALVESVVWISGRKYVLPNLLSLLALWLALRVRGAAGFSPAQAAATLVAFVAVMFSKTTYVAVAPVIALLWLMFWRDLPLPRRRPSLLLWPFAIVLSAGALLVLFITVVRHGTNESQYFGLETVTRGLAALGWMLRLAVTPEDRHFFYPLFEDSNFRVMVAIGCAASAAVLWGALRLLRAKSLTAFAWLAFGLLSLPYLHILPFSSPSIVQDRYLSLAVWPIILLIVSLAWRLKPPFRAGLLLVVAVPWAYQTVVRTHDWKSFDDIIEADLRAFPRSEMPILYKIINTQFARGAFAEAVELANTVPDPASRETMIRMVKATEAAHRLAPATGNPQEAMAMLWQLGRALKQRPDQAKWNSQVQLLWEKQRYVLHSNWKFLATRFAGDGAVRYNAGLWYLGEDEAEALPHLRAAVEAPDLPPSVRGTAFKNLGLALLKNGQVADAEGPLRAALDQSPPDIRAHCGLAEVYRKTGRADEAARADGHCRRLASTEAASRL